VASRRVVCVSDDVQFVPLTRRDLLAWGVATGAAAGLAGLAAAPPVLGRQSWLRRSTYAQRLGEPFSVRITGGTKVTLRLADVDDLAGTTSSGASLAGRDDAFLLELTGPAEPRLTQGVYELRHRTLGVSRLFIVPHPQNSYAVLVNRS
jgi:hypothetical protein